MSFFVFFPEELQNTINVIKILFFLITEGKVSWQIKKTFIIIKDELNYELILGSFLREHLIM